MTEESIDKLMQFLEASRNYQQNPSDENRKRFYTLAEEIRLLDLDDVTLPPSRRPIATLPKNHVSQQELKRMRFVGSKSPQASANHKGQTTVSVLQSSLPRSFVFRRRQTLLSGVAAFLMVSLVILTGVFVVMRNSKNDDVSAGLIPQDGSATTFPALTTTSSLTPLPTGSATIDPTGFPMTATAFWQDLTVTMDAQMIASGVPISTINVSPTITPFQPIFLTPTPSSTSVLHFEDCNTDLLGNWLIEYRVGKVRVDVVDSDDGVAALAQISQIRRDLERVPRPACADKLYLLAREFYISVSDFFVYIILEDEDLSSQFVLSPQFMDYVTNEETYFNELLNGVTVDVIAEAELRLRERGHRADQDTSTLTPVPTVSFELLPTDCPPAATPERGIDEAPVLDALSAALETPIIVNAIGFQNCPSISDPASASYRIIVPDIENLTDAQIIETIFYAMPDEALQLPGSISIILDSSELPIVLYIETINSLQGQNLHGSALMTALGINHAISTVSEYIPVSLEMAETLTSSHYLNVTFNFDYDANCVDSSTLTPALQTICNEAEPPQDESTLYHFRLMRLSIIGTTLIDDVPMAIVYVDPDIAEIITWLLTNGSGYGVGSYTLPTPFGTSECLAQDAIDAVTTPILTDIQESLIDVLPVEAIVSVYAVNFCPISEEELNVSYRIRIPAVENMTDAEIIQAVTYGFPYELLQEGLFDESMTVLTITLDGDVMQEWQINLSTLKSARDQGLGGQALMEALGIDSIGDDE